MRHIHPVLHHLLPARSPGISHGKRAEVVLSEERTHRRELIVFHGLRARIVFHGEPFGLSAAVEFTFAVNQFTIEIQGGMTAGGLILLDSASQSFCAPLALVRHIVGVAMVHPFGPPAEDQDGIAVHTLFHIEDAAGDVTVTEKILSVLMLENHPLPTLHGPDPLRRRMAVPPRGIHPGAVYFGSDGPVAAVGGDDIGLTFPEMARKAVGILVEPTLQAVEGIRSRRIDA